MMNQVCDGQPHINLIELLKISFFLKSSLFNQAEFYDKYKINELKIYNHQCIFNKCLRWYKFIQNVIKKLMKCIQNFYLT